MKESWRTVSDIKAGDVIPQFGVEHKVVSAGPRDGADPNVTEIEVTPPFDAQGELSVVAYPNGHRLLVKQESEEGI